MVLVPVSIGGSLFQDLGLGCIVLSGISCLGVDLLSILSGIKTASAFERRGLPQAWRCRTS